jgi:CUE domain
MTITYEEALATLQSMFADAWTRDLLDEVLRHEKGHMENTVDLILRHGDKDPKILVDQLAAGIDPQQNAAALDEALARQLSMGNVNGPRSGRGSGAGGGTAPRPRGKGKPTTLPDDFLRVPGYTPPPQSSLSDDEALARMLQDELFTEELRRNPDFAHLARGRSNVRAPSSSVGGAAAYAGGPNPAVVAASKIGEMARNFTANVNRNLAAASASNNHTASSSSDDPMSPNIMHKLSEMGDSAKRRLQLLAAQFNATAAGEAMASGPSSSANPTTSEVRRSEFRGLLDDDDNDNMELAARKDL